MLPPVGICLEVAVSGLDQQLHVYVAIHFDHAVRIDVDISASLRDRTDAESLIRPVRLLKARHHRIEPSRREIPRQAVRDIVSPPERKTVPRQELIQKAVSSPGGGEGLSPSMCVALERHDRNLLGGLR